MHFLDLNRAGLSLLLGITSGLLWGGMYGWARWDFGGTHLLLWADANLYSQFFLWRGPQEPHPDVVILAIDETSQNLADLLTAEELEAHPPLSQMTRSPWPGAVFAAVLEQLGSAGARVVAFDVIFDQASIYGPEDDRIFAEAIAQHAPQTVFGLSRSQEVRVLPGGSRTVRVDLTPLWPEYAAHDPALGLVNLPLSPNRQVLSLPEIEQEALLLWRWWPVVRSLCRKPWASTTVARKAPTRPFLFGTCSSPLFGRSIWPMAQCFRTRSC